MAETDVSKDATPHDEDALRHRLLRRIAIAGVSIVSLVAGLAIFDANYVPDSPTAVMVSPPKPAEPAAPLPVSPEPPVATEAKPAESEKLADEGKPGETKTADTKAADAKHPADGPSKAVATPPEMTTAPVVALPREKPLTKPAVAQNVVAKPTATAPIAPEPARTLANDTRHAPPTRPLAQTVQGDMANRRYLVQMGVFSNVSNAEELRAKLEKAGIPAQIEARVQVGPFASKAEAEAAQKKMTELGLSGLLVSARK